MIDTSMPFLWRYLKKIHITEGASGGQERIITESLAEENNARIINIV